MTDKQRKARAANKRLADKNHKARVAAAHKKAKADQAARVAAAAKRRTQRQAQKAHDERVAAAHKKAAEDQAKREAATAKRQAAKKAADKKKNNKPKPKPKPKLTKQETQKLAQKNHNARVAAAHKKAKADQAARVADKNKKPKLTKQETQKLAQKNHNARVAAAHKKAKADQAARLAARKKGKNKTKPIDSSVGGEEMELEQSNLPDTDYKYFEDSGRFDLQESIDELKVNEFSDYLFGKDRIQYNSDGELKAYTSPKLERMTAKGGDTDIDLNGSLNKSFFRERGLTVNFDGDRPGTSMFNEGDTLKKTKGGKLISNKATALDFSKGNHDPIHRSRLKGIKTNQKTVDQMMKGITGTNPDFTKKGKRLQNIGSGLLTMKDRSKSNKPKGPNRKSRRGNNQRRQRPLAIRNKQ